MDIRGIHIKSLDDENLSSQSESGRIRCRFRGAPPQRLITQESDLDSDLDAGFLSAVSSAPGA